MFLLLYGLFTACAGTGVVLMVVHAFGLGWFLGYQNQFRLNIDPWDLQRLIAEANRMGREGVEVVGFGYDYDAHAIVLGSKRAAKP